MIPEKNPIVVSATLCVLPDLAVRMIEHLPDTYIFSMGTPEIKSLLPNSNVVEAGENLMFVGGWNFAMQWLGEHVHPDAVWMLNDDILYQDRWMLDRLWSAMQASCAAVITPVFNSPHSIFGKIRGDSYGLRKVNWIDWCCPLVSFDAWKDVGEFDHDFIGYGADLDWCHRAKLKGYEFFVHESCVIHHEGSVTSEKIGNNVQRDFGLMQSLLRKKWGVANWWELT